MLGQHVVKFRRHWLRLSIRGLIVFVLASGAGLGWIVRSARIQRDAVVAITKNGGNYSYDWEWRDGKSIPGGIPLAPRWLVERIGIDYFGHVTRVMLFPVANDEVLVNVGRLNQLQELNLYRSTVSDAGLSHLNGLTQLTRLYLGKTAVSDAGLPHLSVLGNLHELHLDSTNVSDAGLAHLKRVGKLTKLDLRNTQVTDAGLVHIRGLTDLTRLALEGSRVTNAVIKELKLAFPNLKADIYGPFNGRFTFN
jgi:Leucine-rich repeat (LRR) protein